MIDCLSNAEFHSAFDAIASDLVQLFEPFYIIGLVTGFTAGIALYLTVKTFLDWRTSQ